MAELAQRQLPELPGIKQPIPKMLWLRRTTGFLVLAALFAIGATQISSQEPPKPLAPPKASATPPTDKDEPVKVFTEEVRLPVVALDAYGHYDPTLELAFTGKGDEVSYRWTADEPDFAMPIRVGTPGAWQTIVPTTAWQKLTTALAKDEFQVTTDLYFVNVARP